MDRKIVAVLDEKGGVGKTLCAVHIAGYAVLSGIPTKLLDCNADQGSATDWCELHPEGSQIAALTCAPIRGRLTLPMIDRLAAAARLVVIDGMPYLGPEAEHAAACADVVVVPLRPNQFDLKAARKTTEALDRADEIRKHLRRPRLRRLLVLTQSVAATRREPKAIKLLSESGWGELAGVMRFRDAFAETAEGGTVFELAPGSAAAEEAESMAKVVLQALGLLGHPTRKTTRSAEIQTR